MTTPSLPPIDDTAASAADSSTEAMTPQLGLSRPRPYVSTPRGSAVHLTRSGVWCWAAVGVFVVLVLLLALVVQNDQNARVSFMGAHGAVPVWAAMLFAAVAGALLVAVLAAGRISELRRLAQPRTPPQAAPAPNLRRSRQMAMATGDRRRPRAIEADSGRVPRVVADRVDRDAGERGDWAIRTDDEVIRRFAPHEMRLLVHWNAEVYTDLDEVKKNMDHSDDLTHDIVFERLLADMRARGMDVAEPSDPLHDKEFIRALIAAHSIAPTTDWADQSA